MFESQPDIHRLSSVNLDDSQNSVHSRYETAVPQGAFVGNGFDSGPDIPCVSAGNLDENQTDDPVSMSRDFYANPTQVEVEEPQETGGIWFNLKRRLRGLWGTRHTEDTQKDRELYVRTTIKELIIYVFFLLTLCILTFGMTSSTHYYYTKVMQELFIDSELKGSEGTFRDITTMEDFWRFAEGPLMDGLFWEQYYNKQNLSKSDAGYIYYENKLLGVARVRQLKVQNGSCEVHPDFKEEITSCYDSYSEAKEDTEPFGLQTQTAWLYHTEEELDGSTHWGLLDYTYGGGGYYQDLSDNRASSLPLIENLKQNLWLDRGTRVAFIDFTVYNANINLFCVVRLVIEFPATGGAVPSWQFRTVKLLRYVTGYDYFLLGCEILYLVFILYYIVEEILEVKKHRCSYFSEVWNCLDVLVIVLSLVAFAFNVYRTIKVDSLLSDLLSKPDAYPDFEFLAFWQVQYNNMVAVVVFFAWIKIFKYISFNRTMTQLQSTLSRCSKDIAGFAIMFFIIFFAYAQLGYLIFGTQVDDFSSFPESIFTQFRIILGDFDFHALESANRVLGPIYFLTYVFFVFFVLLNMFLAIINDTYSEVKAEISTQKSEIEIVDFIKKGYNRVLEKLSLKKDRIKDIQDAIKRADLNQDKEIDFEEWRLDLKMRGIPDAEIEAVFARYDQDGDMVLNDNEQKKLQADLERQRANLSEEIELTGKGKKGEFQPSNSKATSHVSFGTPNGSDDESDDDEGRRTAGRDRASKEDFHTVSRRVDRMEHSIEAIVSKIDSVILKLQAMEVAKAKREASSVRSLSLAREEDRHGYSISSDRSNKDKTLKEKLSEFVSSTSLRHSNEISPRSGWQESSGSRPGSAISFHRMKSIPSIIGSRLFDHSDKLETLEDLTTRPKSASSSDTMRPPTASSRPHSVLSLSSPDLPITNNLNMPGISDEEEA